MITLDKFFEILELNPKYEIRINNTSSVNISFIPEGILLLPSPIKTFTDEFKNIVYHKSGKLFTIKDGVMTPIKDIKIFDTKHIINLYA